jgi:hypothetical protein
MTTDPVTAPAVGDFTETTGARLSGEEGPPTIRIPEGGHGAADAT